MQLDARGAVCRGGPLTEMVVPHRNDCAAPAWIQTRTHYDNDN